MVIISFIAVSLYWNEYCNYTILCKRCQQTGNITNVPLSIYDPICYNPFENEVRKELPCPFNIYLSRR